MPDTPRGIKFASENLAYLAFLLAYSASKHGLNRMFFFGAIVSIFVAR